MLVTTMKSKPRKTKKIHEIERCPKFLGCSAPICPIDADWPTRSHRRGERVCYYLTEYAKKPSRPILRGSLPRKLHKAIAEAYPEILAKHCSIKRRLEEAATTPSRLTRKVKGEAA